MTDPNIEHLRDAVVEEAKILRQSWTPYVIAPEHSKFVETVDALLAAEKPWRVDEHEPHRLIGPTAVVRVYESSGASSSAKALNVLTALNAADGKP